MTLRHFARSVSSKQGKLICDPLSPERIAKSQSSSKFPMPMFVLFDLWNTLYTPKEPVSESYHRISSQDFGIKKSVEAIEKEFPIIHKEMLTKYPNYGKHCDDIKDSKQWWRELIVRLYELPHYSEDAASWELTEKLIEYFSSSEAYRVFDDVVPTLEKLTENNIRILGSTNSDDRVFKIIENLGLSKYIHKKDMFLSYDLGSSKPDRAFYRAITNQVFPEEKARDAKLTMQNFLERVWHVGDHYNKDFVGAVKSGWNGVYLDRGRSSVFFRLGGPPKAITNDCFEGQETESLDSSETVMIANNRVAVSSLTEVPRLFGLD